MTPNGRYEQHNERRTNHDMPHRFIAILTMDISVSVPRLRVFELTRREKSELGWIARDVGLMKP